MQSGNLEKIVIATGFGRMRQRSQFDEQILPEIEKSIATITGQKASRRQAKKSIAGFKVREGDVVGLAVTLRGKRMDDFLGRLVNIALPRIRDFRGIPEKAVDKQGNLTIGIRDHIVFPEINADEVKVDFGIEITLVRSDASKKSKSDNIEFYRSIGIPFSKNEQNAK